MNAEDSSGRETTSLGEGRTRPGEADDDLTASLGDLAKLAVSTLPLPETLSNIAEFAVRAIPGADGAGLTLFHSDQPSTIVASADFVRVVDDIQYGLGEGPCITAAARSITVRSGYLDVDPQWPQFGPRVGRLGVHSVLSLPLITGNGVVGAMNVYAHPRNAFDDRAAELGELFAVPAAVSVQNARALASSLAVSRQLEKALNTRAVIDQAVGILIGRTGCSSSDAYEKLRASSQSEQKKIVVVAESLVSDAMKSARSRRRRV